MSRRSGSEQEITLDTITDKTLNMMEMAMERAISLGGEEFGLIVSKEFNARTHEELNIMSETASDTKKGTGVRDRFITGLLERKEIYSEEDKANIPAKFKKTVDQILQAREQAIQTPRVEEIHASTAIRREISPEEAIQNETSRLSGMIKANCREMGLSISEENIQKLSSLIASTSVSNTELHPVYFPDQYTQGRKPESISDAELTTIDNSKHQKFDELRDLYKIVESTLPKADSKVKFREILDKATEEHGSENGVRCAYHLSDENYKILNYSREIPEFYDLSESALLLKDNPKFAPQFENALHGAGPSGIEYLARNHSALLDKAGITSLRTHMEANSHRRKYAFSINKSTELERDLLAPLQPENTIVADAGARPHSPTKKQVGFSDKERLREFSVTITSRPAMEPGVKVPLATMEDKEILNFEKPDLTKRPTKSALAVKPEGYYKETQTQRKEDLVKGIEDSIKGLKPESGTPPTKEKIKDTIRYIQSAVPLILGLSQGEETGAQNLSGPQTTKESKLILRHINRIARDAIKESGIKVKTSLREKLDDLFASKSEREKVKEKIRITAPNLIAALQSHAGQQNLAGTAGAITNSHARTSHTGKSR